MLYQLESRGFVVLFTILVLGAFSTVALKGDIIVGDDVNTFGSFLAGANEDQFAVNVANFLTSGHATKNLLLFEATPGDGSRDYSSTVLSALSSAGFNVTVTTNYASSLSGFDAAFVAEQFPSINFVNNTSLINFANNGGGVYLVGGVGPDAGVEAAGWDSFLNNYGLALALTYNGFSNFPITSSNQIFNGVTSLNVGNGQSIIDLFTNPNAQIVQTFAGQNVVATVHVPLAASVPEPAAFSLLFIGIVAGLALRWLSILAVDR
jgi:hypothetical protein